jgi:uncharacterized membrane protein YdjX (TVP38/TMEM64 family)
MLVSSLGSNHTIGAGRSKKWPGRAGRRAKSHAAGGDGKVSRKALSDASLSRTLRAISRPALASRTAAGRRGPPGWTHVEGTPIFLKRSHLPWIAGFVALAAIGAAILLHFVPKADWTGLIEEWVDASGFIGVLVFAAIYIVATLALLPSAPINIAAGALYGLAWGVGVVMASSLAAALIAFLIARHLLSDRIRRHYTRKGTPAAIDRALRSEGWRAVALLRLSPVVPFAAKNYLFGVSRVHVRDYLIGTALGKLPGTIILTALGTTGRAAMDLSGTARWSLLGAGVAATVGVTWLVGRAARRRLGLT